MFGGSLELVGVKLKHNKAPIMSPQGSSEIGGMSGYAGFDDGSNPSDMSNYAGGSGDASGSGDISGYAQ